MRQTKHAPTMQPDRPVAAGEERPDWLPHEEFPFRLQSLDLPSGHVAYVDEGEGPTLLFVHAGLWSFIWRDTIVRLREDFRTIAIDFPGSGLAPAADTELTIPDLSMVLVDFVDELDLSDVTLVAHDLGGPVALGAAADDPDRYQALVLTNTFAWAPDKWTLRAMLGTMGARPVAWLDSVTNFLVRMAATRFGVGRHLSRAGKKAFRGPYRDRSRRRRIHTLMRSALNNGEHFSRIEEETTSALSDRPMLTIFGQYNDPWGFQDRHAVNFPNYEGIVVPNGYHFPMTVDPDLYAETIRAWWQRRVAKHAI
ncbi:MAG: alpha/beta fold hydrolase [Acidimicrobiia bacterium]|nr:alpha/beta fold hydrolase [Acidimicrobiia bacterium]